MLCRRCPPKAEPCRGLASCLLPLWPLRTYGNGNILEQFRDCALVGVIPLSVGTLNAPSIDRRGGGYIVGAAAASQFGTPARSPI